MSNNNQGQFWGAAASNKPWGKTLVPNPSAIRQTKVLPQPTPRVTHWITKSSPESWLDLFKPYTLDEALVFGTMTRKDFVSWAEDIKHALHPKCHRVDVAAKFYQGRIVEIEVRVIHPFWTRKLNFIFPPLKLIEIVDRIWTAITDAQTRPNVDPVALARESLLHGPRALTSQITCESVEV